MPTSLYLLRRNQNIPFNFAKSSQAYHKHSSNNGLEKGTAHTKGEGEPDHYQDFFV